MFVQFTATDRLPVIINAAQVTFVTETEEGTRVRFGENRSVTIIEPMPEVMERLERSTRQLI